MKKVFFILLLLGPFLQIAPAETSLRATFDWVRRVTGSTVNRDSEWLTAMENIKKLAGPQDAGTILELWKQTEDHDAAYDLAWILGDLRTTRELASQLSNPEEWRREQVALILYGHSEVLSLDQAGLILKTRKLCRFQQLWLITRVVRTAHPSADELAAFLAHHEVIPSPELLYELRTANSEGVAEQVRTQLKKAETNDRVKLMSMLPDFSLSDREALAEEGLADSEPEVRAAAIIALSRINMTAVYRVEERLKADNDLRVMRAVQQVFGAYGTARQMAKYLHTLIEKNLSEDEILIAVEWISELGEARDVRAAEPLREILLRSTEIRVRAAAAEALGSIGRGEDAQVIRAVITNNDEHLQVREAAIAALGSTGKKEDIKLLRQFLYLSDYCNAAALSIAQLDPGAEDISALFAALPWAIRNTYAGDYFYALSLCCDSDSIAQIASAALRADDDTEIEMAAFTLARLDRLQSLRLLQAMAVSGDWDGREKAIRLLFCLPLRDPSSTDTFIKALSSNNESVQRAAVIGLGLLRDGRAAGPIRALLQREDLDDNLRSKALEAILLIDPQGSALNNNLTDSDDEAQIMNIYTLSRVPDQFRKQARRQLSKIFSKKGNGWERFAAAAALSRFGDKKAIDFLKQGAQTSYDLYESAAMLYPLGNLKDGGESALLPLMQEAKMREIRPFMNLMLALNGNSEASKRLLEDLSSDNRRNDYGEMMTAFEVLTLGAKSVPGVVESLLNIINQGETKRNYNFLSGAAVMALGDLGDPRALPALRRARLSIDPLISFYAASAMYKLADKDWTLQLLESRSSELVRTGIYISELFPDASITDALVKNLSHGDWRVRGYAAFALGRRLLGKERSADAEKRLANIAATDYSLRVRDEAIAALKQIADPSRLEETYFEAGLLLDWAGKGDTGFDNLFYFPALKLYGLGRTKNGPTMLGILRSVARGEITISESCYHHDHAIGTKFLYEFMNRALILHLLGEVRAHDAFTLTEKWAHETNLKGTFYEEAQYGALGVLVAEMGDPRGLTLLQDARSRTREWLVRSLLDIGIEKLSLAAKQRKSNSKFNFAINDKTESVKTVKTSYTSSSSAEITRGLGGFGSPLPVNTKVRLQFEDLRRGKIYSGTGLLLWEDFDKLRLRVYTPIGTTVADLAVKDAAMSLAIYHPTSERRFMSGPIGTLEKPSAEFIERAGAFSALRPEHLLAALRLSDKDYPTSEREWRDAEGRLTMRVSYYNTFKKAGLLWAGEINIERPIDGYTLKLNLYPELMRIGERLPENAFKLEPDSSLPVITLSR